MSVNYFTPCKKSCGKLWGEQLVSHSIRLTFKVKYGNITTQSGNNDLSLW